jgi:DNA-binding NarL/FixJ family response regulator
MGPQEGPRFLPEDPRFRRRNALANALLARWAVIGGTGSWLEAHLTARLALSMGAPGLNGCGVDEQEVLHLVADRPLGEPVLVILSDSIAPDLGLALIRRLQGLPQTPSVLLMIQRVEVLPQVPRQKGLALVDVRSLGSGRMLQALQALWQGDGYYDPTLPGSESCQGPMLTPRERQVLAGVVAGQSNGTIAAALGIASRTVRDHVSVMLQRMKLPNRTALASKAVAEGWLHR